MQPTWTRRSEDAAAHAGLLTSPRAAYRCGACGYGAVLATPATYACPMCRSTGWRPDARARVAELLGAPA